SEGVRPELAQLLEAMSEEEAGKTLVEVAALIESGWSPQQLASELVDDLREAFLLALAPELASSSGSERERLNEMAGRLGLARLVRAMEALGLAQVDMREAPDARVVLEVTLVRLARSELDGAPDALAARLARLEERLARGSLGPAADPDPVPAPPKSMGQPGSPPATDPRGRPGIGALRRQRAEQPRSAQAAPPAASEPVPQPVVRADGPRTGAVPDRDTLVEAWGDHLLRSLPARAKVVYSSGRFLSVNGSTAIFAVPNPGYIRRCEEVRPIVEAALGDHFGAPVSLQVVVDETDATGSAPAARGTAPEDPSDLGDDDFDPEDPGEPLEVQSLARSRILEAFPGAEEVSS
ncbi:MAG: hypothetical protein ACRDVW_06290, partial [Acidimicrobiales bacterium]